MIGDSIYRSSRKPRPLCISSEEGRGLIARDRERIYAHSAYIRTRRVAGSQGGRERKSERSTRSRDNRRVMTREEEGVKCQEIEKYSLYCTPHEGLEEAQRREAKSKRRAILFQSGGRSVKTMTLESEERRASTLGEEKVRSSRRDSRDTSPAEDSARKTQSHRAAMHCRSVLPFPGAAAAHTVRVACGPRVYASGAL